MDNYENGWYNFLEDILAEWAEEAQGFRAMHEKSHKHYSKISTKLTIPAIILSTLTGVASFGQTSLQEIVGNKANLYIGILSIISAILSTIAKYMRSDEKSETHRSAAISWDKLQRTIVTTIALPRIKRMNAQKFIEMYREERNRLSEQLPIIPYKVRNWFLEKYRKNYKTELLTKPCILTLHNVKVYREQISNHDNKIALVDDIENCISKKDVEIQTKEEMQTKEEEIQIEETVLHKNISLDVEKEEKQTVYI